MVEDPKWELAILATVQGFYEKLLQDSIGGEVPVPAGLEAISLQEGDGEVHATLDRMRRWLRLLDHAITPAMLRRAFTTETDPEIAEAVLRYFTRKKDTSDVNRDKTDLVATFLYRHPRVPGQWERRGFGLDGSLPLSPFEIALIEILADTDVPSLSEEHVQLLRRFDPLQEEAQNCRDLNSLLDSEIIPKVRELKQALDASFYHPGVLATIAPYNAAFGKKFDEFFHAAAAEIREFAAALQEQGGSILGNVEGVDVTVEHVAALEEGELLKIDYGTALDKFRRVSKLKQVLERRPPIRRMSYFASVPTPATARKARPPVVSMPARASPETRGRRAGHAVGSHAATDFHGRDQDPAGRRIYPDIRARGRPEIPPGGAHAVLQSHADPGGSGRLQRGLSRGKESARQCGPRAPAHRGRGRPHDHGAGRTQAGGEFAVVVEAARRFAGDLAGSGCNPVRKSLPGECGSR